MAALRMGDSMGVAGIRARQQKMRTTFFSVIKTVDSQHQWLE
jgi:hypothetical protein